LFAVKLNFCHNFKNCKIKKIKDASDTTKDSYECVPGTSWMEDCNRCFCTNDGLAASCTKMECESREDLRKKTERDEKMRIAKQRLNIKIYAAEQEAKDTIEEANYVLRSKIAEAKAVYELEIAD
jgi:Pacifastin inhibitor (LCMII)